MWLTNSSGVWGRVAPVWAAWARGQVEIVELVQPGIDLALGAHVAHLLGGFAVAAQAAHQDAVERVLMGAQPLAEPARLLVAQFRQSVVAGLVIGGGVRLSVADENELAHYGLLVRFAAVMRQAGAERKGRRPRQRGWTTPRRSAITAS
jgi:hypothetical protein